jgi:hypothetical protein
MRGWFLIMLLSVLGSCASRPDPVPSAAEAEMLDRLGRDPAVRIRQLERRSEGLHITTAQGEETVFYLIRTGDDGRPLLERIEEGRM